jgi:hypothetical protein
MERRASLQFLSEWMGLIVVILSLVVSKAHDTGCDWNQHDTGTQIIQQGHERWTSYPVSKPKMS